MRNSLNRIKKQKAMRSTCLMMKMKIHSKPIRILSTTLRIPHFIIKKIASAAPPTTANSTVPSLSSGTTGVRQS
jgi:hypothetical protein